MTTRIPGSGAGAGRGRRLAVLAFAAVGLAAGPARAQVAADLAAFEKNVAAAVKAVEPSMVALSIERAPEPAALPALMRLAARPEQWMSATLYRRPAKVLVSGVVMTEEGHILTGYTPLRGEVRRMTAVLPDGKEIPAELVGFDQRKDLALVRAALPAPAVPVFAPDPPKIGQWVIVVGRVPDPAHATATAGIVSARRRMGGAAVQVDAKIDYGNAGGALVDLEGRLLGVTCNISERAQWGQNSGVGFAVTWDKIENALPRLQEGQKTAVTPQPYIGVRAVEGALDVQGALIDEVIPGAPAALAGLKDGDLVTRVDDQPVHRWEDLVEAIRKHKVGDWVKLTVDRLGESKVYRVQVGDRGEE